MFAVFLILMRPTQGPKSAEDIEKEQEAKLKAKYGNMGAKKKLMPQGDLVSWIPMHT